MKTLFLKNGMPIATAVLAIAGAFATTSMQSSSSALAQITGYGLDPATGECDIAVMCSDVPSPFGCKISTGDRAFRRDVQGNCNLVLYRWPN